MNISYNKPVPLESMTDKIKFGSPALSSELDKAYGSSENREVILRDSDDVGKFLKEVSKFEKESEKINLQFG